jgi:hypothetical protein
MWKGIDASMLDDLMSWEDFFKSLGTGRNKVHILLGVAAVTLAAYLLR